MLDNFKKTAAQAKKEIAEQEKANIEVVELKRRRKIVRNICKRKEKKKEKINDAN